MGGTVLPARTTTRRSPPTLISLELDDHLIRRQARRQPAYHRWSCQRRVRHRYGGRAGVRNRADGPVKFSRQDDAAGRHCS
jgi:hypothetical protein